MPYAVVATGRLFAGLANGEPWESCDHGDSWTAAQLDGDTLAAVIAPAPDRLIGG